MTKEIRMKVNRLDQLNNLFHNWITWYNYNWTNRDTGCVPDKRKIPSVFREKPKDINLDDIFCLKDERKVDRTNSFSYGGKLYSISHKNNLVAFKVELHIHPNIKIRVWHNERFIEELPY